MPRINHLKIRKFGNVAPGTELRFDPRGVVLLGRNGTGKTTLLELLTSVCKCDPGWVTKDDYNIEFSISCMNDVELNVNVQAKSEKLHTSSASERSSSVESVSMFSTRQLQHTRHQICKMEAVVSSSDSDHRATVEIDDTEIKYTYSDGEQFTFRTPNKGWAALGLGAFQRRSEVAFWKAYQDLVLLARNIRRFDEGLLYFYKLTERAEDTANIEAIQIEEYETLDFEAKLISNNCARLLLEDFQADIDRSTSGSVDSTQLEYLDLFCQLAGFKRAKIGIDLDERQRDKDMEMIRLSPLRFSVERNGSVLHHHHLSFGQRRLLAFLHYHDSTPSLVIADELVNGMHHEWIAECLKLMRDSQAFLSSQNPLLFDFLTFESAEEVANRFILCDLDEQHRFVWRNMSESEATEFYELHKQGLQHASEILRTRGYW